MADLPFMPFYCQDYQSDVRRLSLEARGLWMEILCFLWRQGGGKHTLSAQQLGQLCGVSTRTVNRVILELISNCTGTIVQDSSGITVESGRLNAEIDAIKSRQNASKKAAQARWDAKNRINSAYAPDHALRIDSADAKTMPSYSESYNTPDSPPAGFDQAEEAKRQRLSGIFGLPSTLQWSAATIQAYLSRRQEITEEHLALIERYYAAKRNPQNPDDKFRRNSLQTLLENWGEEVANALAWERREAPKPTLRPQVPPKALIEAAHAALGRSDAAPSWEDLQANTGRFERMLSAHQPFAEFFNAQRPARATA